MNSIDITKLMVMLEKEPLNVIDIRTNYEYLNGHIPTAKNIDKNVLVMYPNKYLNKEDTYYIYCQSGHSSNNIVNMLNSKGYNTVNIQGGYNNYLLRK